MIAQAICLIFYPGAKIESKCSIRLNCGVTSRSLVIFGPLSLLLMHRSSIKLHQIKILSEIQPFVNTEIRKVRGSNLSVWMIQNRFSIPAIAAINLWVTTRFWRLITGCSGVHSVISSNRHHLNKQTCRCAPLTRPQGCWLAVAINEFLSRSLTAARQTTNYIQSTRERGLLLHR